MTGNIRTDIHRTALFTKFRTESGQRTESRETESGETDTGQDFAENRNKNETRTGHGQFEVFELSQK